MALYSNTTNSISSTKASWQQDEESGRDGGGSRRHSPPEEDSSTITTSDDSHSRFQGETDINIVGTLSHDELDERASSALSAAMNVMTHDERKKMYDEIHGVDDPMTHQQDKTPDDISNALRNLNDEIGKIKKKASYDLALSRSPEYIMSSEFRLTFLRAEGFDAPKAAKRMVKFLTVKHEVFGESVLSRRIYLLDLNDEEQEFLREGYRQLLPIRDRAGRVVLCDIVTPEIAFKTIPSLKTFLFLLSEAADDKESQRRGLVMVSLWYLLKPDNRLLVTSVLTEAWRVADWSPIRFRAVHICFTDRWFHVVKAIAFLRTRQIRPRIRVHVGSMVENQYSLLTFGIPCNALPLRDTAASGVKGSTASKSSWRKDKHIQWVQRRVVKERRLQLQGEFHGTDLPRHVDILLGRGLTYHQHPGNIKLRTAVDDLLNEYDQAKRIRKKELYKTIVEDTKISSRFLKRDKDGWWVEVPDMEAREKVSSMFRTAKAAVVGETEDAIEELMGKGTPTTSSTTTSSTRNARSDNDGVAFRPDRENQYILSSSQLPREHQDDDDDGVSGSAGDDPALEVTKQGKRKACFSLPYCGLDV